MGKNADPNEIWSALGRLVGGEKVTLIAKHIGRSPSTIRKWNRDFSGLKDIAELELLLQREDSCYVKIMRQLFDDNWNDGSTGFDWHRDDLTRIAAKLDIKVPKNLGDNIYSVRHGREDLPEEIRSLAPKGKSWMLLPNGKSKYRFILTERAFIDIDLKLRPIEIPDSTPQLVARYAKNDEQAVLARIRYCRLIDIFMGIASFQLQSHMRTTIKKFNGAQTELDEIYVGVDRDGTQFVIPIQAKSPNERIGAIQIVTDHFVCLEKFPSMTARKVAAKIVEVTETVRFGKIYTIALIEADVDEHFNVSIIQEVHFKLLPASAF